MERHLLLAIGKHPNTTSGLNFVSTLFTKKDEIRFTLLTISSTTPEIASDPLEFAFAERKGLALLKKAQSTLEENGFTDENITLRNIQAKGTRALSLMHEATEGKFDAVVLSHREPMAIDDLLDGSVCREILKGSKVSHPPPIWLCRQLAQGRKGILLCTDGSDPSIRMADHVGFMLQEVPEQDVRVLHIADPAKTDLSHAEAIVQQTVEELVGAGLEEDRITYKIIRGRKTARMILEETAKGDYAVVAMGTTGADRKLMSKLFTGSVARKVFLELNGAVLWASF